MKFGKIATAFALAALASAAGCTTTSRTIPSGETRETVAGFSTEDLERAASKLVQALNSASARFHQPGARRVVNVRPFVIDTLARGGDASRLARELEAVTKEELVNSGVFIVFNPEAAAAVSASGGQMPLPEYVLEVTLQQRNERLDGGDVYQQFAMLSVLSATQYHQNPAQRGLEVFRKRVPITKIVDCSRALN